jgi:hypothetical protein
VWFVRRRLRVGEHCVGEPRGWGEAPNMGISLSQVRQLFEIQIITRSFIHSPIFDPVQLRIQLHVNIGIPLLQC